MLMPAGRSGGERIGAQEAVAAGSLPDVSKVPLLKGIQGTVSILHLKDPGYQL